MARHVPSRPHNPRRGRWVLGGASTIFIACTWVLLISAAPPSQHGQAGMVASDHALASAAGVAVLEAGGNAIDAVVATALACGVVQPAGSGLGGGGFAVVVRPDGDRSVLDFREVAPAAATQDMFVNAAQSDASRIGGMAVGVPGEPAGLAELHRRWGRLPLRAVAKPAVKLARGGFVVGAHLAHAFEKLGDPASVISLHLFRAAPPQRGDEVRRVRLARTLEVFARTGGADLTHGAIARDIALAVRSAGGILTTDDLAEYQPKDRAPVVGTYRGWTVVTMPPPSSGGVVLLQILNVLEGFDLHAMEHNSSDYLHVLTEAMKHAFADRAKYMGDPDRVEIPVARLLGRDRIAEIRRSIMPARTFDRDAYGTPVDPGEDSGTQHISVLDADGMAVALTTTINTSFGSRVIATESGILLNNEMDDFVARPGEPNAYGLIGSEANAVSPGARPLSSMTPTVMISPDGDQRIVVGASGGPFIITSTLQAILNTIDFGMDPAEAVSVPRIHHQWAPEHIFLDDGISPDTARALEGRGHAVKRMPFYSSVQLLHATDDGILGASDPRKGGWPMGAW